MKLPNMKLLIALAAVVLSTQALLVHDSVSDINQAKNAPVFSGRSQKSFGFASVGNGTVGGAGGAVWAVWDAWALKDAVTGNAKRIVYVRGRIDLSVLFTGSPGVIIDVGSWKSIIGGDSNAEITGGGLRIKNEKQVIIQNIKFTNILSYAPGEQPNGAGGILNQVSGAFTEIVAISCQGAEYVWIDHNEFSDDPWNANSIANNRMRHDVLVDVKRASNYITISHNIFRNHNKTISIGDSDSNSDLDSGKLKTSIVANWFKGTNQCNPTVKYGEVHVLNNLFTDTGLYGIGVGAGSSIYAEKNVFNNSRAWTQPDGVTNPIGSLLNKDNLMENSYFDTVPSDVRWNPASYFKYSLNNDVVSYVRHNAGTW